MKNFDWGNPVHWIVLFTACGAFVIFEKPITTVLSGIGLAMKGLGSVPVMVFTGGRSLVAPELGRYSVPGNVGGPLPEAMALDELNPGNE